MGKTMYNVCIGSDHGLYVDGRFVDGFFSGDEDDEYKFNYNKKYYRCDKVEFLYPSREWFKKQHCEFPELLEDVDLS